jgi:hypothetical protein
MVPEAQLKKEVIDWLNSRGVSARKIERGATKSADLVAADEEETYLIELKQKKRFDRDEESLQTTPLSGVPHGLWVKPTGYRDRFAALISDASEQIACSAASCSDDPLRIAWFTLEPPEDRLHEMQLRATLYGTCLAICSSPDGPISRFCLFSTWSSFYTHCTCIDGVVVCGSFGIGLLLNHLSPRYLRLKKSSLAKVLVTVYDPTEAEDVFLLTPSADRPSRDWVAAQLGEKYDVRLIELSDLTFYGTEL